MAAVKRKVSKSSGRVQRGRAKSKKRAAKAKRSKKSQPRRAAKKPKKASERDYGRRTDYGVSVDDYVAKLPPAQQAIVNALRDCVRDAVPGVAESIRWGMPVFARKKLICYASPKADYVRFGFYARIELEDPEDRLAGSLAYVKLRDEQDIERPVLTSWIKQIVEHTDA